MTETAPLVPKERLPSSRIGLLSGDILFNNTNSQELVGKSAIVQTNLAASFSNHMTQVRIDNQIAVPAYVNRYLQYLYYLRFFESRATRWVSQAAFGTAQLKALEIPIPSLDKQREIVALLDRAADIRRRTEAARNKARLLVSALFVDMFGDPTENPKGWDVVELSNIATISSGITKGRKLAGGVTFPAPYMRVANVQDGHLNLTEVKRIEAVESDFTRYKLDRGDLLLTEGGDPDKLGRCAIWDNEVENCLHQNHVFRVRPHNSGLVSEYAAALISSQYGKGYFLRVAKRTTGIASINKTQLSAFPILLPPYALQQEFSAKVKASKGIAKMLAFAATKANNTISAISAEVFG